MRFPIFLLGWLCLCISVDAAAQFTEVACPAELGSVPPNAKCSVRTSFSFLLFGSMPFDTPGQACTAAAAVLSQSSNIATSCKFDATQNSCSCIEEGNDMAGTWSVAENPASLTPACPPNSVASLRTRLPVTGADGYRTTMPLCIGNGQPAPPKTSPPPQPPATTPCPVGGLREITEPSALQHERGKFTASSDLARLGPATAAGQSCMLGRLDSAIVFPVGGYRPAEYQAHLKELWDKWHALLNNANPSCKAIKDDVRREWLRHKLVRDPQWSGPHAAGDAVDIAGLAPAAADSAAAYCGMMRPDPAASPLHFQPGRK